MDKLIKTIAFTVALAGLLAWGIASMAQAPSPVTNQATVLHGQAIEKAVEKDLSDVQRTNF
ncbi:MAG TPA: hypothetical protein VGB30_05555 [bacterium]|jgi:hypothetical protein